MIVTALADELAPIREVFNAQPAKSNENPGTPSHYTAQVKVDGASDLRVFLATARAKGSAKMSSFVTRCLGAWQPRFVILAGIAAGVPEAKIGLGTILISSAIVDVSELKIRPSGHVTTGRRYSYPCDNDLLHPMSAFVEDIEGDKPEIGLMLCQPNIVKAAEMRKSLVQPVIDFFDHAPLGIEMEGMGLAVAAEDEPRPSRPSYAVVKGVVDLANFQKDDSVRKVTTEKVASFLIDFLSAGWLPASSSLVEQRAKNPIRREIQPLFGRDKDISELLHEITAPQNSPVIAIEGIGGIGKTALAERIAEELIGLGICQKIEKYVVESNIGKASDQPIIQSIISTISSRTGSFEVSSLPTDKAVQPFVDSLEENSIALIIDNFETKQQISEFSASLGAFGKLERSRIILTSRPSWVGLIDFGKSRTIPPLDKKYSIELLRYGILERTFKTRDFSDSALEDIFETVGGNPQALLVSAALFGKYPPEIVIKVLRSGRGAADNFFRNVYLASWSTLKLSSQHVLVALRDAPEQGIGWDRLAAIAGLESEFLSSALIELLEHNLVEARTDDGATVYSMHRLTRTFVEGVLEGWDRDSRSSVVKENRRRNVLHTLSSLSDDDTGANE